MAALNDQNEVRIPVYVVGERTVFVVNGEIDNVPGIFIVKEKQQAQDLYVNGQMQMNPDYDERAHRKLNIERINETYQPTYMDYEQRAKLVVDKYFVIDSQKPESLSNYVAEVQRVREQMIKDDETKHPFVVQKKKERKNKNKVVWQMRHFPLSLMQNSLSEATVKEISFRKKYVKIMDIFNIICNYELNKEGFAKIQSQYSKFVKSKQISFGEVYEFILDMIESDTYLSEEKVLPQYTGEIEIGIAKPSGPHMEDIITDTKSMDEAWEKALASHYKHNCHHPENELFTEQDKSERQKIIRTIEMLLDLWVSALRIKTNTVEALKMSLTWFIEPETKKIREKFSKTRLLGFLIFAYKLYSMGIKNFEIFSHMNSSKMRSGPISKQAFESDWLSLLNNCHKYKIWTYTRSIPEIQSMIKETRLHIQHVTFLMRTFGLCSPQYIHDKDKMYKQMLITYTWKWYVKPKLIEAQLPNAIPTMFNGAGMFGSISDSIKTSINDAVNSVKQEVDFDKINETVDLGGQVFGKMLGMSATVESMFASINQILEPIKDFTQFLTDTIDKPKVLALVGLVILWRNVESYSLKALILATGFKILGCYEPVFKALKYIIEHYIIEPLTCTKTKFMGFFKQAQAGPQPTSSILDNVYDLFFVMIDKISNLDPAYCAYAMGAFAMLLGVTSIGPKDLLTAGTAFVAYMRASYYIGSGLSGIQRIFTVFKELATSTIEWIREKLGKDTNKQLIAEFNQWYQSVELLCVKSHLACIPQSKKIVAEAKIIVEKFYEYRKMVIKGELPTRLHHILSDASRQLRPVIALLSKLDEKQIFRASPYHLQFYGQSGIGKSRLARTIFNTLKDKFYPDHPGQIAYPRNPVTKHWDGYSKSMKFLFYDEATPIDDPSIASEMLLVISPVACIVPMADLVDKPTQVEVDFVLSNTNSKYPLIKGVMCMDAIWRRRNLITVECDQRVMSDGVFDLQLFEKFYPGQNSEDFPHLKFIWEPAIETVGIIDVTKVKNLNKREMNFAEFMIYLQVDFSYHRNAEIGRSMDQKTIDNLYNILNKLKNLSTKFAFSMYEDNEIPTGTTEPPEEENNDEETGTPKISIPNIDLLVNELNNVDLNDDNCELWTTIEPLMDVYIAILKGEMGDFTMVQFRDMCDKIKNRCLQLTNIFEDQEYFPSDEATMIDYQKLTLKRFTEAKKIKDKKDKIDRMDIISFEYFLIYIMDEVKFKSFLFIAMRNIVGDNIPKQTAIRGESYPFTVYAFTKSKEVAKREVALLAQFQRIYDLSLKAYKTENLPLFYLLQAFARFNVHRGDFHEMIQLDSKNLRALIENEIIPKDQISIKSLMDERIYAKISRVYYAIQENTNIILHEFNEYLDNVGTENISSLLTEIFDTVEDLIQLNSYENKTGEIKTPKQRAEYVRQFVRRKEMKINNDVWDGVFYFRAHPIPSVYCVDGHGNYTLSVRFLRKLQYEPTHFTFKPGMKFKDPILQSAVDSLDPQSPVQTRFDPHTSILDIYTLAGIQFTPLGVPFFKTPDNYCTRPYYRANTGEVIKSADAFIARMSSQRTFETIWKYDSEDLETLAKEALDQIQVKQRVKTFWENFKDKLHKFDFTDYTSWLWSGIDIVQRLLQTHKQMLTLLLVTWSICKALDMLANCILGPSKTSYQQKNVKGKSFRFTEEATPTSDSTVTHYERIDSMKEMITPISVDNVTANAIRVESNMIIVPYHLISKYIKMNKNFQIKIRPTTKSEDTWILNIKPTDVYRQDLSDTAFICSMSLPTSKRFTKYFVNESQLNREKHENMYIPYFKNDIFKLVVHKYIRMDTNRITVFDNVDYKYPTLFSYSGLSEIGSSGAPVINFKQNESSCILGLQSFTYNGDSFCSLITQEMISKAIEYFENKKKDFKVYMTSHTELENISTLKFENPHLMVVEHNEERILGGTGKTAFEKTFFYEKVPTTRIPALLNIKDPRCRGLNPANDSVNKYGRDPIKSPKQHLIDQAVKDMYMYFKEQGLKQCKVLTEEEAICNYKSAPHINLSTSPGYPWCLMRYGLKGKSRWLSIDEDGNLKYYSVALSQAVKNATEELNQGIFPDIYAVDYLKDELRPPHKVYGMTEDQYAGIDEDDINTWPITNPKTRTITVSPLETTIIYRQDHLDLYVQLQEMARKNLIPYAVGINPDSPTAFKIYNELKQLNDEGVDFDVKNWDGHFPSWLMMAVCDFESLCYDDETRNKRAYTLNMGLMSIPIIHDNIVYWRKMGLISGNPGTTDKNTMGHVLLGYIMFLDIMERRKLFNYMNIRFYMAVVCEKYYGDDRLTVIHRNFMYFFSPPDIKNWYEEHGWPVSTAKKTEGDKYLRPIEDLTFLKRRFQPDDEDPYYIKWKMEEETIWNLLTYIRKSDQPKTQLMDNICNAQEFIALHGKEKYDQFVDTVNKILIERKFPLVLESYEEIKRTLRNRYYEDQVLVR